MVAICGRVGLLSMLRFPAGAVFGGSSTYRVADTPQSGWVVGYFLKFFPAILFKNHSHPDTAFS